MAEDGEDAGEADLSEAGTWRGAAAGRGGEGLSIAVTVGAPSAVVRVASSTSAEGRLTTTRWSQSPSVGLVRVPFVNRMCWQRTDFQHVAMDQSDVWVTAALASVVPYRAGMKWQWP